MSVALRSYADVHDDVPTWVWEHAGNGRIPLGALTLFAGRPAAGKSTAARWFAAQVSRGTLPGTWQGTPHGVAYIAGEESPIYSVKPSLRAADADMVRIWFPETITQTGEDRESRFNYIPTTAISLLVRELRAHDVKLVIVDPLMTMMGAGTDIYRNNEVRDRLQPWVDLAEQIDGVVIGIAHLNKSGNGDVLAGINGSSAFGELCRAAFGFAKDDQSDDGHRVMSQDKNSLGAEDLALAYSLMPVAVTTESGRSAEMPKFTILGDSDRTVGQILHAARSQFDRDGDDGDEDETRMIVLDYLESQGSSAQARDVLKVTRAAGIPDKTVKNKRKSFGVQTRRDGPNRWVWSLERGPTSAAVACIDQNLGISGPSGTEGVFENPEQSRSRETMYA
ncbi:AAA family ATPase [Corynebacterium bovis]|uniref:AAA family ATPase n=1 Tax=Corynebacterium bovis TaxID=36808 RepID=UPI002892DE74|nr:AAA family ATPase [Corynebacterium bovis]